MGLYCENFHDWDWENCAIGRTWREIKKHIEPDVRNGYIYGCSIYVFASLHSDINNIEYGTFIIDQNDKALEKSHLRPLSRYLKQSI